MTITRGCLVAVVLAVLGGAAAVSAQTPEAKQEEKPKT
jgi:hypothetical protein